MSLQYYVNWKNAHEARKTRGFSEGGFVSATGAELPTTTDASMGGKGRLDSLMRRTESEDLTKTMFDAAGISLGQRYMNAFADENEQYLTAEYGNTFDSTTDPLTGEPTIIKTKDQTKAMLELARQQGNTALSGDALSDSFKTTLGDFGYTMMARYRKDLGLTTIQAAALAGNANYETGGFKFMDELSPTVKGSKGGTNVFQFTGRKEGLRRSNFEKFAEKNKLDPRKFESGLDFSVFELKEGDQKFVLKELRNTKTPEEANRVVIKSYLKPAEETANADKRLALVKKYLDKK